LGLETHEGINPMVTHGLTRDTSVVVLATDIKPLRKDHFFQRKLSWG